MKLPKKRNYAHMDSLNSAVLEKHPKRLHITLICWTITIFLFILWASLSQIDDIAKVNGDVIPNKEAQSFSLINH